MLAEENYLNILSQIIGIKQNYSVFIVFFLIIRVKEKEACKFFQQIIGGIEYIHKLGIVHR